MFKRTYKTQYFTLGRSGIYILFWNHQLLDSLFYSEWSFFASDLSLESIFHGRVFLCEIPSGMLKDRFQLQDQSLFGLLVQYWILDLDFIWSGEFGSMHIAMIQCWSYNFDSGTSTAFLFDSAVEAGQRLSSSDFQLLVWCG